MRRCHHAAFKSQVQFLKVKQYSTIPAAFDRSTDESDFWLSPLLNRSVVFAPLTPGGAVTFSTRPNWSRYKATTAVWTHVLQVVFNAVGAKSTFVCADARIRGIGLQISVAVLTVGANFKHCRVLFPASPGGVDLPGVLSRSRHEGCYVPDGTLFAHAIHAFHRGNAREWRADAQWPLAPGRVTVETKFRLLGA